MKRITKIFLAMALCLAISFGLAVTSSAAEMSNPYGEDTSKVVPYADEAMDDAGKEDAAQNGGDAIADETAEYVDTVDAADEVSKYGDEGEQEAEAVKNDFEEIYNVAMDHISEILSLAAFVGSLICAIIYKSGLMPLMENGLSSLKNAAVKIKEATDKAECESKESLVTISRKIDDIEDTVSDMCEAFLAVTDALEGYKDQREHQKRLNTVLEGELDMLYDIFMTSALPEYEKARVGERMCKLKEALNSGEGEK